MSIMQPVGTDILAKKKAKQTKKEKKTVNETGNGKACLHGHPQPRGE